LGLRLFVDMQKHLTLFGHFYRVLRFILARNKNEIYELRPKYVKEKSVGRRS